MPFYEGYLGDSATFPGIIEILEESFWGFVCRPADSSSRSMEKHPWNPSAQEPSVSILFNYCSNYIPDWATLISVTSTNTLYNQLNVMHPVWLVANHHSTHLKKL